LALAQLTRILGDEVYLEYFSMSGREMKIRARSTNAAAVIQQLTEESAYESVVAPQAITNQGGAERFSLDIRLASE
jgi:hypothetical protein